MKVGECKDCSWWVSMPGFEEGECHHRSPRQEWSVVPPMQPRPIALFPPVSARNWCGDFHFKTEGGDDGR